jgi:phytoene/squalene synthetase
VLQSHALPVPLLDDLLSAFIQDVEKTRDGAGYADRAELLDYCRRSANPVGRLLLHLYGVTSAQALAQSDAICSALQLINFWQDLSVDLARAGATTCPTTDCQRHGVDRRQVAGLRQTRPATADSRTTVQWARALMQKGAPLVQKVPGRRLGAAPGGARRLAHPGQDRRPAPRHAAHSARTLSLGLAHHAVARPVDTSSKKPPPRAAASITPSCSCPSPGARPSPRFMPSAAKWTTWWTRWTPAWPAPSWPGGRPKWPRPLPAAHPPGDAGADAALPCYGIEQRHLQAVIEGCQMDLEQTRYLDYPGLQRYCHLVAGVVGEVAARIFGQTDEQTTAYAHKLGQAFQLTNIIRDVGEDACAGASTCRSASCSSLT